MAGLRIFRLHRLTVLVWASVITMLCSASTAGFVIREVTRKPTSLEAVVSKLRENDAAHTRIEGEQSGEIAQLQKTVSDQRRWIEQNVMNSSQRAAIGVK